VDELHLHRGTGGTEVAFLLRLLLQRLGLDRPAHRHKLRILASSASLPISGSEGDRSVVYLWDMFGSNGLGPDGKKGDWRNAIVSGRQIEVKDVAIPEPTKFIPAVERLGLGGTRPRSPADSLDAWKALAQLLELDSNKEAVEVAEAVIDRAAALLESASGGTD